MIYDAPTLPLLKSMDKMLATFFFPSVRLRNSNSVSRFFLNRNFFKNFIKIHTFIGLIYEIEKYNPNTASVSILGKNSWNSISRNFFPPNSIFCYFKNGQKSIFELGKSLKLPKMQFHENKIDLFDFTSFFAWTFISFLVHCVSYKGNKYINIKYIGIFIRILT